MIQTGRVKGFKYEKNRDGQRDVLMLQVELTSKEDVQSVEFFQGASDGYNPALNSKVLVVSNGPAYRIAIAVDDLTLIALEAGERAIRSVLNGEVKASVLCDISGNVVLNSGSDFAVQFSELKSGFDQLKSDHNTHSHTSNGVAPTLPSSASIDDCKVEKVKL